MSKAKIFLIDDAGKYAKEMVETPYEVEEVLQRLLVSHPDLLPGDQIDPESPRRWLLVKQEMGVPGEADESDRWSLDHLFLDQDGIPTFVECKRASDTRNRREVVAQMLDYAANGITYWSVDRLRQAAAQTPRDELSLDEAILKLVKKEDLGQEDKTIEIENYWKRVEMNLHTGKVRLIFVADDIPRELRRLVEFLNEKMADVEVLAVEVKQFLQEGQEKKELRAIVPRLIGTTKSPPPPPPPEPLDREKFLAKCTPEAARFFGVVLDSANKKGYSVSWGAFSFSIRARLANENRDASFLYCWHPNRFEVYLAPLLCPEQESSIFRQELLAFSIFRQAGKFTLRTTLEGEVLSRIAQAYDHILSRVDEAIKYPKASEEVIK